MRLKSSAWRITKLPKAAMTTWACWPTGWRPQWLLPARRSTGRWPLAQRVSDAAREYNDRALGARPALPLEPGGDSAFGDSQIGAGGTLRPSEPRYIKGLR